MTRAETHTARADAARTLRVAAIDDHTATRHGITHQLPDMTVTTYPDIASFDTRHEAVDVVLLDLDVAGTGDTPTPATGPHIARLAAQGHRVLIYTNDRRRHVLALCLAAGARGVIHKSEPDAALQDAIRTVAGGGTTITTALAGLAEVAERRDQLPSLTQRQREILAHLARGTTQADIAAAYHVSERTIQFHAMNIRAAFLDYMQTHTPTDLEHHLGLAAGDVHDWRQTPHAAGNDCTTCLRRGDVATNGPIRPSQR